MTFALVAYLMMAGQVHAYVLDYGLTYDDCQASIAAGALSAMSEDGHMINLEGAPLVCEIEAR